MLSYDFKALHQVIANSINVINYFSSELREERAIRTLKKVIAVRLRATKTSLVLKWWKHRSVKRRKNFQVRSATRLTPKKCTIYPRRRCKVQVRANDHIYPKKSKIASIHELTKAIMFTVLDKGKRKTLREMRREASGTKEIYTEQQSRSKSLDIMIL